MANLPSVTRILNIVRDGLDDAPPAYLAKAARRGAAVHEICLQGIIMGLADYHLWDVYPLVKGYVDSFLRWWEAGDPRTVVAVEPELASYAMGFQGHPDLVLDESLYDLKTPVQPAAKWQLQMAAYRHLSLDEFGVFGWEPREVACIMLDPAGGEPRILPYTTKQLMTGLQHFFEAKNLFNFMGGDNGISKRNQ